MTVAEAKAAGPEDTWMVSRAQDGGRVHPLASYVDGPFPMDARHRYGCMMKFLTGPLRGQTKLVPCTSCYTQISSLFVNGIIEEDSAA